jgi:hypothetical protein
LTGKDVQDLTNSEMPQPRIETNYGGVVGTVDWPQFSAFQKEESREISNFDPSLTLTKKPLWIAREMLFGLYGKRRLQDRSTLKVH